MDNEKALHKEDLLGTEKIWRLCLKMGIPGVLAQVVNLLYNIVDRIYIGNSAGGRTALAGLGLCAPVITLISAFYMFVSGGGSQLAAKALGEGNADRARKILNNGAVLLVIFSFVFGLSAYFARKPILLLVGADLDTTYGYAEQYLSVYLSGTLFVQLGLGLNSFLSAQGKSASAMVGVLIGAALNIALDPLFIFVFGMGIKGAAVATVISQFCSCVYVLGMLSGKRLTLRLCPRDMKLNGSVIKSIFGLGFAPFVMAATESVIGFVLNGRLKYYGDLSGEGIGDLNVSTLAVLQSAMMFITVPVQGFTQGVSPIAAYNFGAKNAERLKRTFIITALVSWGYCCISAITMMVFPSLFGRAFTRDAALIRQTQKYLPVFVSGMLIFGIQRACQTTFVAMTEAKISLFIALLRKIILLVPFAFIFPLALGVAGVYWAECAADFTAATLCSVIFFFHFRAILRAMKKE